MNNIKSLLKRLCIRINSLSIHNKTFIRIAIFGQLTYSLVCGLRKFYSIILTFYARYDWVLGRIMCLVVTYFISGRNDNIQDIWDKMLKIHLG